MQSDRPKGLIPGSGRRGGSKALDSVVSVRFDVPLLVEARRLAGEDGQGLSDWIRNAVWHEAQKRRQPAGAGTARVYGWSCQHMSITSIPGVTGPVTAGCGCEMQPIYESAPAAA